MDNVPMWWDTAVANGWLYDTKQIRARTKAENILDAAIQCFRDEGYERTTINDLAKTADISVGAIYQRFPEKKHILFVLTLRQHEWAKELRGKLSEQKDSPESTEDILYQHLITLARPMREKYKVRRAFKELARSDAVATQMRMDNIESWGDDLMDLLIARENLKDSLALRSKGFFLSKIMFSTLDDLFEEDLSDGFSMNVVLMLRDMIIAFLRQNQSR